MSALFHVARCARMRFCHLISMRPTIAVIVRFLTGRCPCHSGLILFFSFAISLLSRDISAWAASSYAASLALDVVNVATVPRSEAVAVANCVIVWTVSCIDSPRPCSIIILALWKPDCCVVWLVRRNSRWAVVR
jgi:hypothetical protein